MFINITFNFNAVIIFGKVNNSVNFYKSRLIDMQNFHLEFFFTQNHEYYNVIKGIKFTSWDIKLR